MECLLPPDDFLCPGILQTTPAINLKFQNASVFIFFQFLSHSRFFLWFVFLFEGGVTNFVLLWRSKYASAVDTFVDALGVVQEALFEAAFGRKEEQNRISRLYDKKTRDLDRRFTSALQREEERLRESRGDAAANKRPRHRSGDRSPSDAGRSSAHISRSRSPGRRRLSREDAEDGGDRRRSGSRSRSKSRSREEREQELESRRSSSHQNTMVDRRGKPFR